MDVKVYGAGMTVEDIFSDSSNLEDFADRLIIAGRADDLAKAIKAQSKNMRIESSRYSSQRFAFEAAAPIAAFRHAMKDRKERLPNVDYSHIDMSDEGIIAQLKILGKPTVAKATH